MWGRRYEVEERKEKGEGGHGKRLTTVIGGKESKKSKKKESVSKVVE